jgi:hypothetical protein
VSELWEQVEVFVISTYWPSAYYWDLGGGVDMGLDTAAFAHGSYKATMHTRIQDGLPRNLSFDSELGYFWNAPI